MTALEALRAVNFNWTMHIKSVWNDGMDYDVPELNGGLRDDVLAELDTLIASPESLSPLGWVIVGEAGAGKTHFLSAIRKQAIARGAGFVLADMTDVHDFWATVLLSYVSSLQQPYSDGKLQYQILIEHVIHHSNQFKPVEDFCSTISLFGRDRLIQVSDNLIKGLSRLYPVEILEYQNIIRALILLNSNNFLISNIGYSWLQGMKIEEDDRRIWRFTTNHEEFRRIVKGLSWFMSLKGPTVLALDQLDSIVSQRYLSGGSGAEEKLSDEQRVSLSIIQGIAGGLMALRDITYRTLIVIACIDTTWGILSKKALKSSIDRYHPPRSLRPVSKSQTAESLISKRLLETGQRIAFSFPYPTWPFKKECFKDAAGRTPRMILQSCCKHREKCLRDKTVTELTSFSESSDNSSGISSTNSADMDRITRRFNDWKRQADLSALTDEHKEDDGLGRLLQTACRCIIREISMPNDMEAAIDTEFPGGKNYPLLHARLRLIYHSKGDREEHFCFRAILRSHATAYQSRLKAAMTISGIDRNLSFRRLMIIRNKDIPSGDQTRQLTEQFKKNNGLFAHLSDDELQTLWALARLEEENDPDCDQWLESSKPASKLKFMQPILSRLSQIRGNSDELPPLPPLKPNAELVLGVRSSMDKPMPVAIQVSVLTKHIAILAGSGSGKTVLIRRIVEEAALLGIPSLVIDGANDLSRLGDPWETPPQTWQPEDRQKAERYHQTAEVVIWTPGREQGNPLYLEPLPDLTQETENSDELKEMVEMVRESLQEIVAPGSSASDKNKRGVLSAALKYFAKNGGKGLASFVELLNDLPPEAGGGIGNSVKLAQQMADNLKAEMQINVLLRQTGVPLDPAVLFGLHRPSKKTRISVISLIGLSLAAQQQFLNQLSMTLFTWIKHYPAPIRGLLVIDEAKDFAPSVHSTPCKANLIRLTAQARKYGLGLIFATQSPKSIDHNLITNCTTHLYGRVNSPAAIEVVQEQLKLRGSSGQDIPKLGPGWFYIWSETIAPPIKISVSMCLSFHPSNPLTEGEVLEKAALSTHLNS